MRDFFRGKSILITGHTGFKGAWLSIWLADCGACVHGYSLHPLTVPSLFDDAGLRKLLASHTIGDVRDLAAVQRAIGEAKPDIVFHLAAQALVRRSYREPVETFATNLMGTVNVIEASRVCPSVRVCQIVTTDKCYENREWVYPYRETDRLGGHDPYSASKACAELAVASYRKSLMSGSSMSLASARAGNVIGGGDWAEDRLVPDAIRALKANRPIPVRNPGSIRPWQHVLEPLSGYLQLARKQWQNPAEVSEAFNFGPLPCTALSVRQLVERIIEIWGRGTWENAESATTTASASAHEANVLKLDIAKAVAYLDWSPRWSLAEGLTKTVEWYRRQTEPGFDALASCLEQIREYEATPRTLAVNGA